MTHAWWNIRGTNKAGSLRILAASLLAAGLLSACGSDDDDEAPAEPPVTEQPAPETPISRAMDLTILHINDQHSNLDDKSLELSLADATGTRQEVTVDGAGFPRVTAAFKALSADRPNVLKLHSGDALTGTLYFNRAGAIGEPDAAMMNTVCFDTFTLGNHEFDKGDTELKNFIDRLQAGECKTPVISANVNFGANSALNPAKAPDHVKPYVILERDEQPIGVIGLTVAGKTKTASSPDADTTFESEVTAAQRAIDELTAQGVNKIVIASHIGYSLDKSIIAQLRGVDVVVGGDSHTLLGPDSMATYNVGTPGGAYAEALKNADGETTCLVQAWEYSQVVGELNVSFDDAGRVTQCAGTPHVLIDDNFEVGGAAPTAADLTAFQADVQASGFLRITKPDTAAAAVLAPYAAKVEGFKAQTVATTGTNELCSRRVPGGIGSIDYTRSSASCTTLGEVNRRGGDIQQLVAQAYLEVANANYGGADITLQSGGGVRIPLQGQVTAAKVIEVLPFGNMLYRLDITGAEARAMIEDGLDGVFKADSPSSGPYPYTGGMRFDVDANQAKGNRAINHEVFNNTTQAWEPLSDTKTYRLFVLSFNATGGDGYTSLADVPAERRTDIGVLDADVFQSYIDTLAVDPITNLPLIEKLEDALYSTRSFIDVQR